MRKSNLLLERLIPRDGQARFLTSVFYASLLAVALLAIGIRTFGSYGWAIFVFTPFAVGFLPGVMECYRQPCSKGRAVMAGLVALLVTGVLSLLLGVEGAICLFMSAPLAIPCTLIGALLGCQLMEEEYPGAGSKALSIVLVVWPMSIAVEPALLPEPPVYELTTSLEIAAPPERVWENIVSFHPAPPPRHWMFRLGIAYPVAAEIENPGAGGVRRCIFSSGAVIEPIEVWDPPRQLSFSVTSCPPPMVEWSPWQELHPPHLEGFLVSKKGRFLLHRLANGNTLLEGTSWYKHSLWPAAYWKLWADPIIRRIHLRVFGHIQSLSEQEDFTQTRQTAKPHGRRG